MEAEAVIEILKRCMADWNLIGSEIIEYEIEQTPNEERIEAIKSFLTFADERVMIDKKIITRAHMFHGMGIDTFDALHLASAESVGAVFLSTDDSLIRHINKHNDTIHLEANNPLM